MESKITGDWITEKGILRDIATDPNLFLKTFGPVAPCVSVHVAAEERWLALNATVDGCSVQCGRDDAVGDHRAGGGVDTGQAGEYGAAQNCVLHKRAVLEQG